MNTKPENPVVAAMIDEILADVRVELIKATEKHGRFPTCHHGHSVIMEELDELFDEIKADRGQLGPAKREAAQLACVAVRYILDLCTTKEQFDRIERKIKESRRPFILPHEQIDIDLAHERKKRKKDA